MAKETFEQELRKQLRERILERMSVDFFDQGLTPAGEIELKAEEDEGMKRIITALVNFAEEGTLAP